MFVCELSMTKLSLVVCQYLVFNLSTSLQFEEFWEHPPECSKGTLPVQTMGDTSRSIFYDT
jgi:hypothetical protein